MPWFILPVVGFVMGLYKGPFIKKDNIVSFSLKGGLFTGLLSVILFLISGFTYYIFGFVLLYGDVGIGIGGLSILSGGLTFICIYAGAWVIRSRKKDGTEKSEENPANDEA